MSSLLARIASLGRLHRLGQMLVDLALVSLAWWLAFVVRFDGEGNGEPDAPGCGVLGGLVDVRLQVRPRAPRHVEPLRQALLVRADHLDGLVVRGKQHAARGERAPEHLEVLDEPRGVVHGIGQHHLPRVTRAQAHGERVAVGGHHRYALMREGADDAERIRAGGLKHHRDGRLVGAHPRVTAA